MSSANADHPPLNDRIAPDGNSARTALPAPNFSEKVEAWLSRMSMKSNFMQKAFSSIWLPYAFRSGLTMKRVDDRQFVAVLPFRRFNRNWYNAMAGAALLGNSEVAGGLYLFGRAGSDYVVVCKEMHYRFLRPCYGPAMYEVMNSDDLDAPFDAPLTPLTPITLAAPLLLCRGLSAAPPPPTALAPAPFFCKMRETKSSTHMTATSEP
jgi:acyl-coenzyme A thioesterase PaaI-like protein